MKVILVAVLVLVPTLCLGDDSLLPQPATTLVVGRQYEQELARSFSASWSRVTLREILQSIERARKISCLLDRRIDPTRIRQVAVEQVSLFEGVAQVAERYGAQTSFLRNGIYIGPPSSAAKLRTLIQLRSDDLKEQSLEINVLRQAELNGSHLLKWGNLDEPKMILEKIARHYHLDVQGLDLIPHDLWATATLPKSNAAEALSVILIQFDLTFAWLPQAQGVKLLPVPEQVSMERRYTVPKPERQRLASEWKERFPELEIHPDGAELVVSGLWEQHVQLKNPNRLKSGTPTQNPPGSLLNEQFSLRVSEVPVSALIEKLRSTGTQIDFDPETLEAAGIDLSKRINLNLEKASTEELFQAICGPLGLEYKVEAKRVLLSVPASSSQPGSTSP